MIKILLATLLTISLLNASNISTASCKASLRGNSPVIILMNMLKTVHNVLPIKFAGITLLKGSSEDPNDGSNKPLCICKVPFPRVGLTLSFHEPLAVAEVTNIPNCSPIIGGSLPLNVGAGQSFQSINKQNTQNTESYQVNYVRYPLFYYTRMLVDVACMTRDRSIDYGYLTTIDPLWQNDQWSAIINPDAYLVANQFAQYACIADAVASQMGYPLDPLYWCQGSWNQTFPLTKATSGVTSPETAMGITSRILFKLHRQFMLWGTAGKEGICQFYPMPIMRKSQYSIYPLYPLLSHRNRVPIGRTGMIWGVGQEVPFANSHNWVIMIYRKRNCCIF